MHHTLRFTQHTTQPHNRTPLPPPHPPHPPHPPYSKILNTGCRPYLTSQTRARAHPEHTRAVAQPIGTYSATCRLQDAAMYHNTDLDGDGLVDEMELREFLSKKRKEGVLRKDMDVKASTLMEKFGQQGNGTLTMPEFLELQREVIDQTVSDPAQEVHDMQTKVMQQERQLQTMERMVNRRMTAIEDFLGKLGKHMEARGS